jgi:hypothetical protein
VQYLNEAEVKQVGFVRLQERGIHRNGHTFFTEKNHSESVQRVVESWIEKLLNAWKEQLDKRGGQG